MYFEYSKIGDITTLRDHTIALNHPHPYKNNGNANAEDGDGTDDQAYLTASSLSAGQYLVEIELRDSNNGTLWRITQVVRLNTNAEITTNKILHVLRKTRFDSKRIIKGQEPTFEYYAYDSVLGEVDVSTLSSGYKTFPNATTDYNTFNGVSFTEAALTALPLTTGNQRLYYSLYSKTSTSEFRGNEENVHYSSDQYNYSDVLWRVTDPPVVIVSPTPNQQILKDGPRVDLSPVDAATTWFDVTDPNNVTAVTGGKRRNIQKLDLGTYTYEARATGKHPTQITFTITPPTITVSSPTDLQLIEKGGDVVNWAASIDNSSIITVVDVTDSNNPKAAVLENLQDLPLGTYTYEARGTGATSVEITFTIQDTTLPNVVITSPTNLSLPFDGAVVPFTATATDNLDGAGLAVAYVNVTDPNNEVGLTAQQIDNLKQLGVGTFKLRAVAVDNSGNRGFKEIEIEIFDHTYIDLTINSPVADSNHFTGEVIRLSATAIDISPLGLRQDISRAIEWFDGNGSRIPLPYSIDTEGTHTLTAKVTDVEGNTESTSVTFTVQQKRPKIVLLNKQMPKKIRERYHAGPDLMFLVQRNALQRGTVDLIYQVDDNTPVNLANAQPVENLPTLENPKIGQFSTVSSTDPVSRVEGLDENLQEYGYYTDRDLDDDNDVVRGYYVKQPRERKKFNPTYNLPEQLGFSKDREKYSIIKIPVTVLNEGLSVGPHTLKVHGRDLHLRSEKDPDFESDIITIPFEVIEQPTVEAGIFLTPDVEFADLPSGTTEMDIWYHVEVSHTFFNKKVGPEAAQLIFRNRLPEQPERTLNLQGAEPDHVYNKLGVLVSLVDEAGVEMQNGFRTGLEKHFSGRNGYRVNKTPRRIRLYFDTNENDYTLTVTLAQTWNYLAEPYGQEVYYMGFPTNQVLKVGRIANLVEDAEGTIRYDYLSRKYTVGPRLKRGNLRDPTASPPILAGQFPKAIISKIVKKFHVGAKVADSTPPVITITSPVDTGLHLKRHSNPAIPLRATVNDNIDPNVTVTWYDVSDPNNETEIDIDTFFANNIKSLPVGNYAYEARSTDFNGNTGKARITFTIFESDTVPPTITIQSPQNNQQILRRQVESIHARATVTDTDDNLTISWYDVTDASREVLLDSTRLTFLEKLAVGTYTYEARATDEAGNTGRARVTFSVFRFDTDPPVVHITHPFTNQEIKKGARFPLTATAVDGLDGDVTGSIRWDDVSDRNSIFEITKGFGKKTKVGKYTFRATAIDAGGNEGYSEVTFDIVRGADKNPPNIAITSVEQGQRFTVGSSIELIARAFDTRDGDITDRIIWTDITDTGIPPVVIRDPLKYVVELGRHVLRATVSDAGNNEVSTDVEVWGIDVTLPVLQILEPAAVTFASVNEKIKFKGIAHDNIDGDLTSSITWQAPDGIIDGDTVTYINKGDYVLVANIEDSSGNRNTAAVTIRIADHSGTTTSRIEFIRDVGDLHGLSTFEIENSMQRNEDIAISIIGRKPADPERLKVFELLVDILTTIRLSSSRPDPFQERVLRKEILDRQYNTIVGLLLGSTDFTSKTRIREFGGVENKRGTFN